MTQEKVNLSRRSRTHKQRKWITREDKDVLRGGFFKSIAAVIVLAGTMFGSTILGIFTDEPKTNDEPTVIIIDSHNCDCSEKDDTKTCKIELND